MFALLAAGEAGHLSKRINPLGMPKKKTEAKIVPRRGPATNLRKAGPHDDKQQKALKALDQKEGDDLVALGSWAFEDDENGVD